MKAVTVAQMKALDRRTIAEHGIPGEVLMERAGRGVASAVCDLAHLTGTADGPVLLIAGKGNNGGDAFAAARLLQETGFDVRVWLAASAADLGGDARVHFERMAADGVPVREMPAPGDWADVSADEEPDAAILVDGLLGTGAAGVPREPVASAIRWINQTSARAFVVSIDIPSGLDGDTGEAAGEAVVADVTVTMGCPKAGMLRQAAVPYVGSVEVADIGIPDSYIAAAAAADAVELICRRDLEPLFPRRARVAHKGAYGRVLLIGGARGYAGAITMAAQAAIRSGAGLVHVLVPHGIASIVAGGALEAMVAGGAETDIGSLSAEALSAWRDRLNEFDAVLVGPGMTRHEQTKTLVRALLRSAAVPLIIDADAISVFASEPEVFATAVCPRILTPHPGELARLVGGRAEDIQAGRFAAAGHAAALTDSVIVLKGAGTVVAAPGGPLCVNLTGNPGMATGGSGDVLAGLLAGLVGQGLAPRDAALASVYLHGRAGDRVAWQKSQAGLTAGDLIEELPYVFAEVCLR